VKAWRWWDGYAWTEHASDPSGAGATAGYGPSAPAYGASPGYGPSGGAAPPSPYGPYGRGAPGAPGAPGALGGAYGTGGQPYGYAYGSTSVSWAVQSIQNVYAKEVKAAPWARRALFLYIAVVGVGLLQAWAASANIRRLFHDIRIQQQTGVVPQYHPSPDSNLLSLVSLVVAVAFYVLLLMWQFRAAETARMLNLPARRSPALGVGSWFIPVVNLWFPYQAIRDCLPPDDPGRRTVVRMWAFLIATIVMDLAAAVTALVGSPIAIVLAVVVLALAAGFAFQASQAVVLIGEAHYRLMHPGTAGPTT
jgi:hypothetical protein